ncbi:hypothetical protein [Dongia rigui]|uniref:Uncharacterized protein n=1 Tax=Dongia rigui TaxID=940149 RepID=A0ABU5E131_9PROT|nr:hypothetical protein [Dongia rigui]MDY0873306.1 hypothetical protein [Dongia rigui]
MAEAQAALSRHPAEELELWSPENAAETHGVQWFCMLQQALRSAAPDREPRLVLDCGGRADLAAEALRLGLRYVALRADPVVTAKVAAIATGCGGHVLATRPTFS